MESIKNNKILSTIFWVAIIGTLGLAVLAYFTYHSYTESLTELEADSRKLASAEGAPLYPNQENVEKLATQVNEYETAVGGLTQVLLHLQQPAKPILDTEFQSVLKQRISDVKASAEGKTALPKDFNLGFDAYTKSLPKSPEAARQLNDYFEAVDAVVNACINSGVASIDSLTRTELDIEKPEPPPPPTETPAQKKATSKSRTKGKAKASTTPVQMTQVVERRQLILLLTTDQVPLMNLLNTLADANQMPFFTIVKLAHIENEKQEGPLTSTSVPLPPPTNEDAEAPVTPSANPDGSAPAAPTGPEIIMAAKPSATDAIAIMGHENLKVQLNVDIVRYQEAPTTASK
jgi:hypothetical protein